MRKKGNVFLLEEERNKDLMRVYREVITHQLQAKGAINMKQALALIVNSPSSRYWVSTDRACSIIYKMNKGVSLDKMKRNTLIFYRALYADFLNYKSLHPELPIKHIVEIIVQNPAPCFLLSPRVAGMIIYKMKKQCLKETMQRLRYCF